MFTGIITDLGEVLEISGKGDILLRVRTAYKPEDIALGASIAHNGICLTVIETGSDWFAVQASAETLAKTTMGGWRRGDRLNLERALRLGDELGGHIVSGHVDGVARVVSTRPENESLRFTIEVPAELARFIAPKGSVTLNGVSLTVNEVEGRLFGVNIIPHTQSVTTFGDSPPGTLLNIEIDMLARYVERMVGTGT